MDAFIDQNEKEEILLMENEMHSQHDFPTAGVELMHFLVVSNYQHSLAFYRDVLGATIIRELPGTLCFLHFAGSQIILSVPGGPTKDKPTVTFASPTDPDRVIGELSSFRDSQLPAKVIGILLDQGHLPQGWGPFV